MDTFRVKQFIQDTIGHFGYELHRKRPPKQPFQPYVEQVSLAGVSFQFWVGDIHGKEMYNPAEHEPFAEHTETARLLKPGDRVLEVGTHHGFTAMLISRLVGPDGFLLGVEPSPFNAMMAAAQIGLNRVSNCQILQAAASDRKGTLTISRDTNALVLSAALGGIEAPAVTVDELDSVFGPFNALKIDVEAYEERVLTGAAQLLKRHPKLLLELHTPYLASYGSTMESILKLLGPSYFGTFVPRDVRTRVQRYPEEPLPMDVIVNLFIEHR